MLRKISQSLTEHRLLYGLLAASAIGLYAGLENARPYVYLGHEGPRPINYAVVLQTAAFVTFVTFWLGYSFIKIVGFVRSTMNRKTLQAMRKPVASAVTLAALLAFTILSIQHGIFYVVTWVLVSSAWGVGITAFAALLLSLAQFVRYGFNRQTASFAKKPALLSVSLLGAVVFIGVFASMAPGPSYAFVGY